MSEETTVEAAPTASDTEALAAAQAGYAKARGIEPPASATSTTEASSESGDVTSAGSDGAPDASQTTETTPAPTPAAALQTELSSLRDKVREMEAGGGATAQEIRRLHGEIGNLNRHIRGLNAKSASASEDELAAALKRAEAVASEYPELGAPMVDALKAMHKRLAAQPAPDAPASAAAPATDGYTPEQRAAIKAIDEAHPDRNQLKGSHEFQAWFATQSAEYQQAVKATWNPAVLSDCYTKFKTHRAAEQARAAQAEAERKRKQDRLAAAESPQGVPGRGQPNTLPDEAGFQRGYDRVAKRRHL